MRSLSSSSVSAASAFSRAYLPAYFLIWLYQPLLQQLLFPIVYFGLIRAAFSIASLITTWNINAFEKLFGSTKRFLFWSGLFSIIPLFLLALFPSVGMVIVAIILISAFSVPRFSRLNSISHHHIPSERRATVVSGISMLNKLVFVVMNPVVGFFADSSLSIAFLLVGGLALVGLFLCRLPSDIEG